jgi:hypothetical protein
MIDVGIPREWAMLRANKWWFASILCLAASERPSSEVLPGLQIVSRSVLPLDVSNPSEYFASRQCTLPITTWRC